MMNPHAHPSDDHTPHRTGPAGRPGDHADASLPAGFVAGFDEAAERELLLISRVVDHEATPADWAELEAMSLADPSIWHRLAQAERAHAALSDAVEDAIAIAECVELPRHSAAVASAAAAPTAHATHVLHADGTPAPLQFRTADKRGWAGALIQRAGWSVAASLALYIGVQHTMQNGPASPQQPAGLAAQPATRAHDAGPAGGFMPVNLAPSSGDANGQGPLMHLANYSPDDLWSGYVRRGAVEGRVLREMPAVVIEVRRQQGGEAYELIVERRVRERRVISPTETPVKRVQVNEFGQPVAVPVDASHELDRLLGARESPI
jgi:hypothetical protein